MDDRLINILFFLYKNIHVIIGMMDNGPLQEASTVLIRYFTIAIYEIPQLKPLALRCSKRIGQLSSYHHININETIHVDKYQSDYRKLFQ